MDRTEVEETIRKLKADRDATVAAVAAPFDAAIQGLQTLLQQLRTQAVAPPQRTTRTPRRKRQRAGHPRGVDAVRQVLMDTASEMDVRQIVEELDRRGWKPNSADPVNAISSSASRAVQQFDDVVRRRNPSGGFLYRFERPPTNESASTDEVIECDYDSVFGGIPSDVTDEPVTQEVAMTGN